VIAQAAETPETWLTYGVCLTGLPPLAWIVRRHWQRRPIVRLRPEAFPRSDPVLLGGVAMFAFPIYVLCGILVQQRPLGAAGVVAGMAFPIVAAAWASHAVLRRAIEPQGRARVGRGLLILWAAMPLVYGLLLVMQQLGLQEEQQAVEVMRDREPYWEILALFAVVGAPMMEELCFRGLLYPAARRLAGPKLAILVTGTLFGLMHFDSPAAVLPLALLGCALALILETTGALLPCIVAHGVFNALTVTELLLAG